MAAEVRYDPYDHDQLSKAGVATHSYVEISMTQVRQIRSPIPRADLWAGWHQYCPETSNRREHSNNLRRIHCSAWDRDLEAVPVVLEARVHWLELTALVWLRITPTCHGQRFPTPSKRSKPSRPTGIWITQASCVLK